MAVYIAIIIRTILRWFTSLPANRSVEIVGGIFLIVALYTREKIRKTYMRTYTYPSSSSSKRYSDFGTCDYCGKHLCELKSGYGGHSKMCDSCSDMSYRYCIAKCHCGKWTSYSHGGCCQD